MVEIVRMNNPSEEITMQGIRKRPRHILTFDLEEHFHASRFDSPMRRRHWSSFESRIHTHVERITRDTRIATQQRPRFLRSGGWLSSTRQSFERSRQLVMKLPVSATGMSWSPRKPHRVFDKTFIEPNISWRTSRDTRSSDSVHRA